MKENQNIDELVNGLIDGELTARQQIEVQRLISHDAQIAERLRELRKCKMLVGSLPRDKAPAGMAEEIKASLERRTLLSEQAPGFEERAGAKHLLGRRILAAAAMIGLVAVLGAVIYTIIAPPESSPKPPVAVGGLDRKVELVEIDVGETGVTLPPTSGMRFYCRLELKTGELISVEAFINRAIKDNGLLEVVGPGNQADKGVYALSCSRQALSSLLADLENVWGRFDSATLSVEADQSGEKVVVDIVTIEQITEIVNQNGFKKCVEVAKNFAFLNDMAELLPGKEVFAAIGDTRGDLVNILPPKPRLTGPEKKVEKQAGRAQKEAQVHLTIVVVSSE
jgi:hypothetical protein